MSSYTNCKKSKDCGHLLQINKIQIKYKINSPPPSRQHIKTLKNIYKFRLTSLIVQQISQ
jgi:arsenate reductase-like glutaredoxin family protein